MIKRHLMNEYRRGIVFAVVVHLLTCGVVSRTPVTPLARHRDVMTTQGTVRGYYSPHPPHYAFLGLPYARPPTHYSRFKAPQPPASWTGIFEAIHRVKCPQPDGTGEENCLVVNVFAPEHASSLPVIVHIHDGGFQKGSWGSHIGFRRLLQQEFIFVTFNHRLGAFGFLCLDLEEVSGNNGLKDQVAALYWINKNIAKFGGNQSDVTVYGTGSGAVSIEMLLFSGLTEDFLEKVILESGSMLSPTSISYEPILDAMDLAYNLGFNNEQRLDSLIDFLHKQPYKKIANTSKMFLPCIENGQKTLGALVSKDPRDYILNDKYKQVRMLIMYTNAEEISIINNNIESFSTIPDNFGNLLPNNLIFNNEETKQKVANLVKEYYFEDLELSESVIKSYVDYVNDIFLEYPIIKGATHYASKQNIVFLMKFLYKEKLATNDDYNIPGAHYGDPFKYISANEYLENELIAEQLITLLTNFIKLGDPTPLTTHLIPVVWQPVHPHLVDNKLVLSKIAYLIFGKNIKNGLLTSKKFKFWDQIYDMFYMSLLTE